MGLLIETPLNSDFGINNKRQDFKITMVGGYFLEGRG
jgi:hypothetical protein